MKHIIHEYDGITKSVVLEQTDSGVQATLIYEDGIFYNESPAEELFASEAAALEWARGLSQGAW
jgi:predicted transcriptional regulator